MRTHEIKEDGQADTNAQLRAVVDRILRLKEEGDALTADIRDIYAEAKSNGFDKTALGLVVSQLRKRAKDPAKYTELSEIASTYLAAYEGGTLHANIETARGHAPARDLIPNQRTADQTTAASAVVSTTARAEPAADEGSATVSHQSGAALDAATVGPAPAGRAADESPAPIHVAPPIDLTIPAFLVRGSPDCVVSETSK